MADEKVLNVDTKGKELLEKLKLKVKSSYMNNKPNVENFHEWKSFAFRSNITAQEKDALGKITKPALQFNMIESLLSRVRGEFAKQEPSFVVSPKSDVAQVDPGIVKMVEGILMCILHETKKTLTEFNAFTDQTGGGFSVLELYTEYENDYTFNQRIGVKKAYEPTMCGFDPMARDCHKGDGKYCWQVFPMTEDDLKKIYPDIELNGIATRFDDFSWAYTEDKQRIIMVCDFFEKTTKRKKLVELSNGKSIFMEDYNKDMKEYREKVMKGEIIVAAPTIIKSRMVDVKKIVRYRIIENQILDTNETIFTILPLVFVDGNSQYLRHSANQVKQFTRSLFYQAIDAQRLMNVAGQSLCNGLENIVQQKLKIAIESIPEQYLENFTNIQAPSHFIYKAFKDDGVTPIPMPQEVSIIPLPPEVVSTFMQMPQMIQGIMGSFEASLGLNQDDLSGIAMMESITQTNSTTMPYIVNFMGAWNQIAQGIIDILPQVYSNARSIPVMNKKGKKTSININGFGNTPNIDFKYPTGALGVVIEAGVNFEVQKSRAVKTIGVLAQAFPAFAELINTEGLSILLDNIDIRGGEQLKSIADQFMKQKKQQAAQQQNQQNPMILREQNNAQKNQIQAQKNQTDAQIAAQQDQTEQLKAVLDYKANEMNNQTDLAHLKVERDDNLHHVVLKAHEAVTKRHETKLKANDLAHKHAHQMLEAVKGMNEPEPSKEGESEA